MCKDTIYMYIYKVKGIKKHGKRKFFHFSLFSFNFLLYLCTRKTREGDMLYTPERSFLK